MPNTGNRETKSQRYEREKAQFAKYLPGKQFTDANVLGGEEALKALDKKIHGNVKFYDSPVWGTFIAWMLGKDDEMTEEKLLELSMDDVKKYAREFIKEVDAHPIQQPYIDGLDAGKINENAAWYGTFFGRALSKISYKGYPEKESVNTASGAIDVRTKKMRIGGLVERGIANLPRVLRYKKQLKKEQDGVNPEGVSRSDSFADAFKEQTKEPFKDCFYASNCSAEYEYLLSMTGNADESFQTRAMHKLLLEMDFMPIFSGKALLDDRNELRDRWKYISKLTNSAPATGLKGFSDEECMELLDTPMDILKEKNPLLWKKSLFAMKSIFPKSRSFASLPSEIRESILTPDEQKKEKEYADEDGRKWGVMDNGHTLEKIYRALTAMGDNPEAVKIKEELRRGENRNFPGKDANSGSEYMYRMGMDMLRRLNALFSPVAFIPDVESALSDMQKVLSFNRDREFIEIFKPNLKNINDPDLSFMGRIIDKADKLEKNVSEAQDDIIEKISPTIEIITHLDDIKENPESNWGDVYAHMFGELEEAIFKYFEAPEEKHPLNADFIKLEEIINPAGAEKLKKMLEAKELEKTAVKRPVTRVMNLEREEKPLNIINEEEPENDEIIDGEDMEDAFLEGDTPEGPEDQEIAEEAGNVINEDGPKNVINEAPEVNVPDIDPDQEFMVEGIGEEELGYRRLKATGSFRPFAGSTEDRETYGKSNAIVKYDIGAFLQEPEKILISYYGQDFAKYEADNLNIRNLFITWCLGEKGKTPDEMRGLKADEIKKLVADFEKDILAHPVTGQGSNKNHSWYGAMFGKAFKAFEGKTYPDGDKLKATWDIQGSMDSDLAFFALAGYATDMLPDELQESGAFMEEAGRHTDYDLSSASASLSGNLLILMQDAANPGNSYKKRAISKLILECGTGSAFAGKGLNDPVKERHLAQDLDKALSAIDNVDIPKFTDDQWKEFLNWPLEDYKERDPENYNLIINVLKEKLPTAPGINKMPNISEIRMKKAKRRAEELKDAEEYRRMKEYIGKLSRSRAEEKKNNAANAPLYGSYWKEVKDHCLKISDESKKVLDSISIGKEAKKPGDIKDYLDRVLSNKEMSEECGRAFDSIFAPLKESQERLLDYRGEGNEYGKTEFYDRFQISSKNGEYKNIQLQQLIDDIMPKAGNERKAEARKIIVAALMARDDVRVDYRPIVYYPDGRLFDDKRVLPSVSNPSLRYDNENKKIWEDDELRSAEEQDCRTFDKRTAESDAEEIKWLKLSEEGRIKRAHKRVEIEKLDTGSVKMTAGKFRETAISNGWASGDRGEAIDSIIEAYEILTDSGLYPNPLNDVVKEMAETKADPEKAFTSLRKVLKTASSVLRAHSADLIELKTPEDNIDRLIGIADARSEWENREEEKKKFVDYCIANGWEDDYREFLGIVYEAKFNKEGLYNEEMGKVVVDSLMPLTNPLADDEIDLAEEDEKEKAILQDFRNAIGKIPENELTDVQKKLREALRIFERGAGIDEVNRSLRLGAYNAVNGRQGKPVVDGQANGNRIIEEPKEPVIDVQANGNNIIEEPKNVINRAVAEAKEKAQEAEAPERDKKKNDILKEAEENRADNNKDELNVINDPPENAGVVNAAYNSIPKRCRDLLKNSEEFDRCAEVFDTKKRGRLFNWNSSEYNSAKKAVEEFRTSRDSLNSFIEREAGKRGFEMGLTAKRLDFENKERILEEKLSKYIRKVTKGGKLSAGTKGMDKMTQDAGAARLAGATQLYNIILPEGKEYMDKLVNTEKGEGYDAAKSNNAHQVFTDKEMEIIRREAKIMRKTHPGEGYGRPDRLSDEKKRALLKINYDRQQREGARRIRYTELHKDKYSALKEAGEKNAHRRAARQARAELAAQAAPEVPEV